MKQTSELRQNLKRIRTVLLTRAWLIFCLVCADLNLTIAFLSVRRRTRQI